MDDVTIDGMEVEGVLGKGAMAMILRARLADGTPVAVKLLLPKHMGNPEVAERFICEGQALSELSSRYLPRVLGFGTTDSDQPYFVMELLDGVDLEALLSAQGPPPPAVAVRYVAEACEAVAFAHEAGIVHRDVKPGNLFVSRSQDGTEAIKLLDFGIAKLDNRFEQRRDTTIGLVMGTSYYMSPEQIRSSTSVTFAADIWSLGVVLFELLTGQVPFNDSSMAGTLHAIINLPPPGIESIMGDLPEALGAVLSRCLAKDPSRRFGSARELAAVLRDLAPQLEGVSPIFVPPLRPDGYAVPIETSELPRANDEGASTEAPLRSVARSGKPA